MRDTVVGYSQPEHSIWLVICGRSQLLAFSTPVRLCRPLQIQHARAASLTYQPTTHSAVILSAWCFGTCHMGVNEKLFRILKSDHVADNALIGDITLITAS